MIPTDWRRGSGGTAERGQGAAGLSHPARPHLEQRHRARRATADRGRPRALSPRLARDGQARARRAVARAVDRAPARQRNARHLPAAGEAHDRRHRQRAGDAGRDGRAHHQQAPVVRLYAGGRPDRRGARPDRRGQAATVGAGAFERRHAVLPSGRACARPDRPDLYAARACRKAAARPARALRRQDRAGVRSGSARCSPRRKPRMRSRSGSARR